MPPTGPRKGPPPFVAHSDYSLSWRSHYPLSSMYRMDMQPLVESDGDDAVRAQIEAALDTGLHHTQRPEPPRPPRLQHPDGAKNVHLPETFDEELNRPRCTARNRAGYRCQRYPVQGARVCSKHGGNAPQVRRKAALRLAALVDPAIVTIARIMTDTSVRPGDRLRAANSVLDRAGIVRQTEMETSTAQALLVQRLLDMREEAAAARPSSALVDGEHALKHRAEDRPTAVQRALWDDAE